MGQSEKLDWELVEGARLGVGDKNDVLIDAGCCGDAKTAKIRARQFEVYRILWLEEPLSQDNLDGYRELSQVSNLPIAAEEGEGGIHAWRDLIERGGIDIAQVDLARNGFPVSRIFEFCIEENPIRRKNAKPDIPVIDGYITVPEEPGLGIELDEETVARYRVG